MALFSKYKATDKPIPSVGSLADSPNTATDTSYAGGVTGQSVPPMGPKKLKPIKGAYTSSAGMKNQAKTLG